MAAIDKKTVSSRPQAAPSAGSVETQLSRRFPIIVAIVTLIGFVVRTWSISFPDTVVFDELHSGNHINRYLNHTFFVDVHPPLGKLIYTYTAWHLGYDAKYTFDHVDQPYAPSIPYAAFRTVAALLSTATIPIGIATLRKLGCSSLGCILAGLLLILDNALVVQNKFFLLDSSLLFFAALTLFAWVSFINMPKTQEFSIRWYTNVILAGVSLGCTFSVRYCGAYMLLTVAILIAADLWFIYGDLTRGPKDLIVQTAVRAAGWGIIPLITYSVIFVFHMQLLSHTGSGATFMSQEYQVTLEGTPKFMTHESVGYGSYIRLLHEGSSGGFLHSHAHNYPTGSKQQQVSVYPFRDANNIWLLQKPLRGNNGTLPPAPIKGFEKIDHGSIIRLMHNSTTRKLHSHDERAPLTENEHHNEVSCYGDSTILGDLNDNWKVEVLEPNVGLTTGIKALETRFRLKHAITGCYLFSHEVTLPEWGYNQQEVTCAKNGKKELETWRIDHNINGYQKQPKMISYKPLTTFGKFVELHKAMFSMASRIKDVHPSSTEATSWPLLGKTMVYWSSRSYQASIVLVGNPLVWALVLLACFSVFSMEGGAALLWQRQIPVENTMLGRYRYSGWVTSLAWLSNFLPYIFSSKQLFLANYLPALYFGILCIASQFDRSFSPMSPTAKNLALLSLVVVAAAVFVKLSPLTYGETLTPEKCEALKLRSGWEWDCFHVDGKTRTS